MTTKPKKRIPNEPKEKITQATQVPAKKPGFWSVSASTNLYLRVRDTGTRAWVFRYRSGGKTVEIGLGPTSDRKLAQARKLAGEMRAALLDGKDPASLVRVRRDLTASTFRDYAESLIESKRSGWRNAKHVQQWENTLEQYAFPTLADKLPSEVSLADVKAILQPIWATKTETASRLRQRIEAVLDYAAVHENEPTRGNPARWKGVMDKILPAARKVTKRVNHAAAPYAEVPALMAELRQKETMSAYCLRFTILTAARSGEARGALWSEIDTKSRTWTIPENRMKAGRRHRVPLCDEAMEIIATMQAWRQKGAVRVFPGPLGGLLSDVAVNKALHEFAPNVTVHGFRSSFREWGAETTAFPSAVLELALAHVNKDKVEEAYQRSDLFDRRIELMTAWGRYCRNAGNVVQLAKRGKTVA